jgi:CheY-like chemotaxis protein
MDQRRITTLIVDDEPLARRVLREGLELIPEIEITGEAANGRDALQQIAILKRPGFSRPPNAGDEWVEVVRNWRALCRSS